MRLTPVETAPRNVSDRRPSPELEPIFHELVERWNDAGQQVPGDTDQDWAELARRPRSWRR
ncbi:hypothetical protein [Streptomyces sp. NPDC005548]|uniref:hypothetical protein n=1 Tax=Streptomyces sp. NPDC005548 TaxID=3364724 RepID=UPI0036AADAE0